MLGECNSSCDCTHSALCDCSLPHACCSCLYRNTIQCAGHNRHFSPVMLLGFFVH